MNFLFLHCLRHYEHYQRENNNSYIQNCHPTKMYVCIHTLWRLQHLTALLLGISLASHKFSQVHKMSQTHPIICIIKLTNHAQRCSADQHTGAGTQNLLAGLQAGHRTDSQLLEELQTFWQFYKIFGLRFVLLIRGTITPRSQTRKVHTVTAGDGHRVKRLHQNCLYFSVCLPSISEAFLLLLLPQSSRNSIKDKMTFSQFTSDL